MRMGSLGRGLHLQRSNPWDRQALAAVVVAFGPSRLIG